MFRVIKYPENNDYLNGHFQIIKSGFKTATQANKWCRKNLSQDAVHFHHQTPPPYGKQKYAVLDY